MVCPGTFHKWSRGLGVTGTVIDRCLGVGVGPLGSACSGWCVGEDWGGGPTHSALETLRLGSGRAECPTPGNGRGGNGEWGGGACRLPGGPIPPGVDGAYEGLCDSWDSFGPFLIRLDVGCRGLRGNIVHMFISGQGVDVTPPTPFPGGRQPGSGGWIPVSGQGNDAGWMGRDSG